MVSHLLIRTHYARHLLTVMACIISIASPLAAQESLSLRDDLMNSMNQPPAQLQPKTDTTDTDNATNNAELAALPDDDAMGDALSNEPELLARSSWRSSIMFSITDLRKLQDILLAVEERKRIQREIAKDSGRQGPRPGPVTREAPTPREVVVDYEEDGTPITISVDSPEAEDPEYLPFIQQIREELQEQEQVLTQRRSERAPTIYLNSIVYVSADDWAIWINGEKYSPNMPATAFTIDNVSERKVRLSWQTLDLDSTSPGWRSAVEMQEGNIEVNENAGLVTFTLYPNQTFIGRSMEIIEGRSMTASLDMNRNAAARQPGRASRDSAAEAGQPAGVEEDASAADNGAATTPRTDRDRMNDAIGLYRDFFKALPQR